MLHFSLLLPERMLQLHLLSDFFSCYRLKFFIFAVIY